jgi:TPR repeat protein
MRIVLALLLWVALSVSAIDFDDTKVLAEQGNVDAQTNLGLMYDIGQGTPQDDKEALKWYKAALRTK